MKIAAEKREEAISKAKAESAERTQENVRR